MTKNILTTFCLAFLVFLATATQAEDDSSQIQPDTATLATITELKDRLANPDSTSQERAAALQQLAQIYLTLEDVDKASDYLKQSLDQQDAPSIKEFQAVGRMLLGQNKIEDALEVLTRGEEAYPESTDIAMLMTYPLRDQGDWTGAVEKFEKVEKLTAGEEQTLNANFYDQYSRTVFVLGAEQEREGDIEKAAQSLQRSLELIPEGKEFNESRARTLNYLGYMWIDNDENLDVAGALVKRAAKLDPGSGAIADSVGWFYYKKGQYRDAMHELMRAESLLEEGDMDGEILSHMALTFLKLGNRSEAIDYIKRAIESEPDNQDYKAQLKQIRGGGGKAKGKGGKKKPQPKASE